MCTIFTPLQSRPMYLAKNYDCIVDGGMIFTNKRGMKKCSLVMPPQKTLKWLSTWGSVTFSQSGKGNPSSGINEKGLIVEQATCPSTIYPVSTEKPQISCLEATQYLLDMCETVPAAIKLFDTFTISQLSGGIHFFLMDATGNRAIVEFFKGEKRVTYLKDHLPILTNSDYHLLLNGKEVFTSAYEENSFTRFEIIKKALSSQTVYTINEMFDILAAAKRTDTVWSIVYDLEHQKLIFKTCNSQPKSIDLNKVDYSPTSASYLYDLKCADMNDQPFTWQPYSRAMNQKNLEHFYNNPKILEMFHLSDAEFIIKAFDEHITRIENT